MTLFSVDDLHEARTTVTELTRRLHELELELRRLENEREELTAAYKEAEAVSLLINFKYLNSEILLFKLNQRIRVAKPRNNVRNVWSPSSDNIVMMLNVVLLKRMRKLKQFGE